MGDFGRGNVKGGGGNPKLLEIFKELEKRKEKTQIFP